MPAIKTILVPTDFSAASERALRYACDLADVFGASLHVIHVLENPFIPGGYMEMYAAPPGDYLESLDRQARAHLDTVLTAEQKSRYSAELALRSGAPAQQILEYAKEHGAIDLVVISTTGRGGVARLVMGSVTNKIVRTAPCPVLTLHPHDRIETGTGHRAA
ncbi:MAG: universal stress protein [Vicinamibacterales bacterium]